MNNDLLKFLQKEIDENKISHAFLVETNDCEKLFNDICSLLIKNQIIPNTTIDNNISINIIKPENNLIDKNKILDLQKFIMTKSIINKYKVYFILNAEYMNLSSFNKLLKVLEEPADNVIGFLITNNTNQIISTIKSRCKRFKYDYQIELTIDDTENLNKLKNIQNLTYEEIILLKKDLLTKDKIQIIELLNQYQKYLSNQMKEMDTIPTLANLYKILDNIIVLIKSNVNLELCLDKMFIEMRK